MVLVGAVGLQTVRVIRRDRRLRESNAALSVANQDLRREWAVERIRQHVQNMEQSLDFERVLSLVANDMKEAGLDFETCSVDVLDDPADQPSMAYFETHGFACTTFKLDPSGDVVQQSYNVPSPFPDVTKETIERFIQGKPWQGRSG